MPMSPLESDMSGKNIIVAGPLFAHEIVLTRCPAQRDAKETHPETAGTRIVPGGAGQVALMCAQRGASVHLAGFRGEDAIGHALAGALDGHGIQTDTLLADEDMDTPLAIDIFDHETPFESPPLTSIHPPTPKPSPDVLEQLVSACEDIFDSIDLAVLALADVHAPSVSVVSSLADSRGVQTDTVCLNDIGRLPVAHPPVSKKKQPIRKLQWIVAHIRQFGGRICFTNGCFDLLHAGHVAYLREASQQADCFILALNSDESVRKIKGASRPVLEEQDRIAVLSALQCVDYITVFDTENVIPLLDVLRPEVYVKGGDYTIDTINQVERRFLEGYGAEIVLLTGIEGASTTEILRRIHGDNIR